MTLKSLALALATPLLLVPGLLAVEPGNLDDFEDGSTQGWRQGLVTGQPTNQPDGGPGGAGDAYLQTTSMGGVGPTSRLAVFNDLQWIGDYNALGSEVIITMMLANFGASELQIRIGVEDNPKAMPMREEGGSRKTSSQQGIPIPQFVSSNAFILPADGVWREASFVLSDTEMTSVGSAGTLAGVLSDVTQFRVITSSFPAWIGEATVATLGMDDIRITSLPVELMSFTIE